MNKLERSYELLLAARQRAGEVAGYRFEGLKLRLADRTFYTPDFLVILGDCFPDGCTDGAPAPAQVPGQIELHEVKGFWEEDARIKIKVAAEQYPWFVFRAFTRKRPTDPWREEAF